MLEVQSLQVLKKGLVIFMDKDLTLQLPNGDFFQSWEKEQFYEKELHVACNHSAASDNNESNYFNRSS